MSLSGFELAQRFTGDYLKNYNSVLFGIAILVLATCIMLSWQLYMFRKPWKAFAKGVGGRNLESVIAECLQHVLRLERRLEETERACHSMEMGSDGYLQGIGVVRFNAFEKMGGDQSFSVALLDGKGNGVVISSLYGRDESRVYAKPVAYGKSEYALSAEEIGAIRKAMGDARGCVPSPSGFREG